MQNLNTDWAILCPGPSLYKLEPELIQHDPGCVIAVNSALLQFPYLPAYWCLLDDEVFKSVTDKPSYFDVRLDHLTLFTRDNFGNGAERNAAWNEQTRDLFNELKKRWICYRDITTLVDYGPTKFWKQYTIFCAIALADMKGAKRIFIYGADWKGKGYSQQGHENARTRHNEKRWAEETALFEHVSECLWAKGKQVWRLSEFAARAIKARGG